MFISIVSIDHQFSGPPAQCSLPTGAQPRRHRHGHRRARIEGRLDFSVLIPTSYATEMQGKKNLQIIWGAQKARVSTVIRNP